MKLIIIAEDAQPSAILRAVEMLSGIHDVIVVDNIKDLPEEIKTKISIPIKPFELPELQTPIINERNSPIPDKYMPKHKTKK